MNERLQALLDKARAQKVRRQAIAHDLPDSLASKYPSIYRGMKYDGALITAGTRIRWGDVVKKAAVDLWDRAENDPDNAPTLWADLDFHMGYRIIPEVITVTTAFSKGEIGYWPADGLYYKAKRESVVYTPAQYPQDWEVVTV